MNTVPDDPDDKQSVPDGVSSTFSSTHTDFRQARSYGDHLELDTLLSAQHCLTDAHDEPMFIIIHHVQELWMKLIIHEPSSAMRLLEVGQSSKYSTQRLVVIRI